jgi:hypothetical protein
MRTQTFFEHHGRRVRGAWISFQPDGSISVGLSDRAFMTNRFRERVGIWNAYNRVGIAYEAPDNPSALVPVDNPHFTFHPALQFHLKGQLDRSTKDEDLFSGIAEVAMVLQQETEMPWLRLTTRSLSALPVAGLSRADGIDTRELSYQVPEIMPAASGCIEVDFVRSGDVRENAGANCAEWI